jgi:ribosomal protein S18 acetylase RimI-like enzyme
MSTVSVRTADVDDLAAITSVFLECWRVSYADVLPSSVLARMDEESARELWAGALQRPGETLLAESGGSAVGLTRFSVFDGVGYLASLYVSPRSQGAGLGGSLITAAESAMLAAGAASAMLWVFAANEPSIAFYRRRGWLPTGAQRTEAAFGAPEVQFAKTLRQ